MTTNEFAIYALEGKKKTPVTQVDEKAANEVAMLIDSL
jgi:hypothetical protein